MNFILVLGVLLILGLVSTRVVKLLNLPNVTGYLVAGLLAALGCVLVDHLSGNDVLTEEIVVLNDSVSSVALGFIALSIGEEFKFSKIKGLGSKILIITILQALLAMVLVDVVLLGICYLLNVPVEVAICLGAIATATAPAATLMVIHQYKAKGPLVDLLLPVVALDDALGLIFFAISVSISKVIATGITPSIMSLCVIPLIEIIGSIVLGFLLGLLLRALINFFKSRNNHVIMIIAFTLIGVGACSLLNMITIDGNNLEFSNLLCCMMIGATYINFGSDEHIVERDFSLVERWTPSLFLLFFVLSGAHLVTSGKELLSNDTNMLFVLIIFVDYIVARSLGKYFGAYLGCKITKRDKHITNYLGITLLPQAGVAIGMANTISKMEPFNNGTGDIIVTVVLCATLIYELFGPLFTKWALRKTGEIPNESGIYPYEENKKS